MMQWEEQRYIGQPQGRVKEDVKSFLSDGNHLLMEYQVLPTQSSESNIVLAAIFMHFSRDSAGNLGSQTHLEEQNGGWGVKIYILQTLINRERLLNDLVDQI